MLRLALLMIGTALVCLAEEQSDARLLASKNVLNEYLVEGKDITIQYSIYNIGASAATNVELIDESFAAESFEVVRGLLKAKWDRIAPSSNVTHSVIVRPNKAGGFNFTAGTISYSASEEATKPTFVYTSSPGEGSIVAFRDYDRLFSPHILDWTVFAVMCIPSLAIPYMLWLGSKSKYDKCKPKKN